MKFQRNAISAFGFVACLASAKTTLAGMPKALPIDVERFLRVNDTAYERLQAISFFLMTFVLCAVVVKLLWNFVARDFPILPRLSFGKAAAGVFLWGLLFIIVLTMISGARELMTPGAWEPDGVTYKLRDRADTTRSSQKEPQ